jgi:hypothetical protein
MRIFEPLWNEGSVMLYLSLLETLIMQNGKVKIW